LDIAANEHAFAESQYQYLREQVQKGEPRAAGLIRAAVPSGLYYDLTDLKKLHQCAVFGAHEITHPRPAHWAVWVFPLGGELPKEWRHYPLLTERTGFLYPVSRKKYPGNRFALLERISPVDLAIKVSGMGVRLPQALITQLKSARG
jgi:hypothetical protein